MGGPHDPAARRLAVGRVRLVRAAPALLASAMLAFSLGLSLLAYWPGLMIWDSVRQYDQALSGRMDDWHPPLMEWIWRQFSFVAPGPAPMLVLQLALYALGYGLLIASAWRAGRQEGAGEGDQGDGGDA